MPYTCTLRPHKAFQSAAMLLSTQAQKEPEVPREPEAETQTFTVHPLKVARNKRNLTQQMLADFTQLSLSTIQRAEQGQPVTVYVRQQICDFFGMTWQELGLCCHVRGSTQTLTS